MYIRSMCIYTDHFVPKGLNYVDYNKDFIIFNGIGYFDEYEKAYEWLIKNGKKYTEEFNELHNQPCAFVIKKSNTIDIDKCDDFEDYMSENDLYFLSRDKFHYVFDEKCYEMCLTEHLMYVSHDYDTHFPSWIKYVKNDIFIGYDCKHIKKIHKFVKYSDNDIYKKKSELEKVKKYSKTKNIEDLEELYDKKTKLF